VPTAIQIAKVEMPSSDNCVTYMQARVVLGNQPAFSLIICSASKHVDAAALALETTHAPEHLSKGRFLWLRVHWASFSNLV